MKILLLGASGQVGHALREPLANLGTLRACTRADMDICDHDILREKIMEFAPDVIVNAAAYTAVDRAESEEETAFDVNAVAVENELAEMNDVDITSVSDADFLVYDSTATKWENQAISGALTISNTGVATLSSGIDATKIADGSVDDTEFQYLNGVTSAIQTQIDSKQDTIDASNRLSADLIHDGSVDNTEFGYLNGVTSAIQTQIDTKASNGFAVAMAIAL
mgnify:CR=1 FL=1